MARPRSAFVVTAPPTTPASTTELPSGPWRPLLRALLVGAQPLG